MAGRNQTAETKFDKKSRPKVESTFVEELTNDLVGLTRLPGGPIAVAGDGTIQAQAARLGDGRLQSAQRQTLAAEIGRVQGNRHLQRVVASQKGDDERAPYQSNIPVTLQRSRADDEQTERARPTGDTHEKDPIVSVSMDFGSHVQQPHWGSVRRVESLSPFASRAERPNPFASRAVRERPQPAPAGATTVIQAQDVKAGGVSFYVTDFGANVVDRGLEVKKDSRGVRLGSKPFMASGEVKAVGPKSRVGQWDLGFLQTVYRSDRNFYYDGPKRIVKSDICTVLPVRDWVAGRQPWYDGGRVQEFESLPQSVAFSSMSDAPITPLHFMPWKDSQGNSLHHTDGMDIFRCWLTVRNRIDFSKRYLRFADWRVNYSTSVDVNKAIDSRVTPRGGAGGRVTRRSTQAGSGGKAPRLSYPRAKDVTAMVSHPW